MVTLSIPDPTTKVTITRGRTPNTSPSAPASDPWDPEPTSGQPDITVVTHWPATFCKYRATVATDGAERSHLTAELLLDTVDLRLEDTVTDEGTTAAWRVTGVDQRPAPDAGDTTHTWAMVHRVTGEV